MNSTSNTARIRKNETVSPTVLKKVFDLCATKTRRKLPPLPKHISRYS